MNNYKYLRVRKATCVVAYQDFDKAHSLKAKPLRSQRRISRTVGGKSSGTRPRCHGHLPGLQGRIVQCIQPWRCLVPDQKGDVGKTGEPSSGLRCA